MISAGDMGHLPCMCKGASSAKWSRSESGNHSGAEVITTQKFRMRKDFKQGAVPKSGAHPLRFFALIDYLCAITLGTLAFRNMGS
jgi:hypothetical protein